MVDTLSLKPVYDGNQEEVVDNAVHIGLDGGKSRSRPKYVGTACSKITLTWILTQSEVSDFEDFYNDHAGVSFYLSILGVTRTVKFISGLNKAWEGASCAISATLEMEAL